jgi:prepilin-type N-terminal cleavage/methylation domain-containing protein
VPTLRRERPSRANRGFTLIELLVVIAIMGVTLTVGIKILPALLPANDLDAAARDLSSSIEDARSVAVLKGRRVFVDLWLGTSSDSVQKYRSILEPLPGQEKDADQDEYLLTLRDWKYVQKTVRVDSIVIGENDPVTSGNFRLVVQPDGTMQGGVIRLWSPEMDENKDKKAGWATVQITGLLGQARVIGHYVEPELLREEAFR